MDEHKRYKLVIFDLDGTLLDTVEGSKKAIQYTIEQMGFSPLNEEQLKSFTGPPIQESFKRYYDVDQAQIIKMVEIFRNRYKDFDLFKAVPYDNIYDLMSYMVTHDMQVAIATYKRQDYASKLLEYFGFSKYTNAVFGADVENKLTKVDIIRNCLDEFKYSIADVIMIGDTYHDAQGAAELGIDCIGVTYGYGFKNKKEAIECNCIFSADNVNEILNFFKGGCLSDYES